MTIREHIKEALRLRDEMRQRIAVAKKEGALLEDIVKMQWEEKELDADTRRWVALQY